MNDASRQQLSLNIYTSKYNFYCTTAIGSANGDSLYAHKPNAKRNKSRKNFNLLCSKQNKD